MSRSPCRTWISTLVWLSSAVLKISLFLVGIVVLRSMSRVNTPPLVSMPRLSGVTSSSSTSLTSPASTPPWMAAPTATTSSGLTPLCGSLPMSCLTRSCTAGTRVMPPTRITWWISPLLTPASLMALSTGATTRSTRSCVSSSNFARVRVRSRCLRPVLVGRDERQVDGRAHRGGELDLGLLRRLVQPLQRHLVDAQVDALALLELRDHPVDDGLVEVVAAQVRVAVGGADLEHALPEVEDGDVEGAAAEVEHEDRLVVLLVEAVRERGRRGLVDDAHDLEAGDLAGVLGGLALRVVEVRRHGDDRLVDLLAQVLLGVPLELLQDHRGDLWRRRPAVRRRRRLGTTGFPADSRRLPPASRPPR